MKSINAFVLILIVIFAIPGWSKPEYAVKTGVNCVACHYSPWGGGPRTVYGKFYGSKGLPPGKYSSQDTFSGSARIVSYYPNATSQVANGTALMEAAASGNAAVIEGTDKTNEVRVIATYNMAPLSAGAREAYARVKFDSEGNPSSFLTVGRMNIPFGLMTDEHRTYTKLQTASGINNFDTGLAYSGVIFGSLSYDAALFNDIKDAASQGQLTSADVNYGAVGNLRWFPAGGPLFLGVSQNYRYSQIVPAAYATSVYSVISLEKLTKNLLNATLSLEAVTARNWNNIMQNNFFIPSSDASYLTAVTPSQSLGVMAKLKYDIGQRWSVFYKYDSLTLDTTLPGDAFLRSALGVEFLIDSNIYVDVRAEKATVTRTEISSSSVFAAQDDIFAMLRLWL